MELRQTRGQASSLQWPVLAGCSQQSSSQTFRECCLPLLSEAKLTRPGNARDQKQAALQDAFTGFLKSPPPKPNQRKTRLRITLRTHAGSVLSGSKYSPLNRLGNQPEFVILQQSK